MARKRRRNNEENVIIELVNRVVMLLAAFLLLLSYVSMVVNPSKAWFMTGVGLLFVPIAVINGLFLLGALKRMSKSFLIPLIALLPSLILIGRFFQFSSGAEEADGTVVKMVSYNVGLFRQGRKKDFKGREGEAACMDSVVNFLRRTDADIICLQEVNLDSDRNVNSELKEKFPDYNVSYYMYVTDERSYGNVTLSRFPITDKGKIDFDRSSNLAIWSDIVIGKETVRVYNCHLQSYNISPTGLLKDLGRDSTLVKDTEEKMKRSIKVRSEQVEQVMSDIEECPAESIVAGDLNDSPMSYTYFRLNKGRQDMFVEAGKGFGATYSLLWPMLRIDYVLVPDHYDAVEYKVPKIKCSDHYPVVTRFNVKGG